MNDISVLGFLKNIFLYLAILLFIKAIITTFTTIIIGVITPILIVHYNILLTPYIAIGFISYWIMSILFQRMILHYEDPAEETNTMHKILSNILYLGFFCGQITFSLLLFLPMLHSFESLFLFIALQESIPYLLAFSYAIKPIDRLLATPLLAIYTAFPIHWLTVHNTLCEQHTIENLSLPAKGLLLNSATITLRAIFECHTPDLQPKDIL